ncbi:MAG: hypothetical protein SV186_01865 [Candidatus Nanohaloarchaea archaeon]|nr:hypothetical protein [Candidatus Nanohaloarchaea archaeon]
MPLGTITKSDIQGWDSIEDIAGTLEKREFERTELGDENEIVMEIDDDEFLAIVASGPDETASDYRSEMNARRHTQIVSTEDFREFTFTNPDEGCGDVAGALLSPCLSCHRGCCVVQQQEDDAVQAVEQRTHNQGRQEVELWIVPEPGCQRADDVERVAEHDGDDDEAPEDTAVCPEVVEPERTGYPAVDAVEEKDETGETGRMNTRPMFPIRGQAQTVTTEERVRMRPVAALCRGRMYRS